MPIFSVYVINRAGGLIYQMDHTQPKTEVEKTFSFPLELTLKIYDERVVVSFGQRDGIKGLPEGLLLNPNSLGIFTRKLPEPYRFLHKGGKEFSKGLLLVLGMSMTFFTCGKNAAS